MKSRLIQWEVRKITFNFRCIFIFFLFTISYPLELIVIHSYWSSARRVQNVSLDLYDRGLILSTLSTEPGTHLSSYETSISSKSLCVLMTHSCHWRSNQHAVSEALNLHEDTSDHVEIRAWAPGTGRTHFLSLRRRCSSEATGQVRRNEEFLLLCLVKMLSCFEKWCQILWCDM